MKPGQIVYHQGKWFRVLKPDETVQKGDWLEWDDAAVPELNYACASVGTVARHYTTGASGYKNAVFLREIDPLLAAMLKVKRKANQ